MLRNVFTKALWDSRRSLLGWAIGLAALTLMYASFYPSMKAPAMAKAMESYPESLKRTFSMQDVTSAEGYLGSTVFGILVPLLVILYGIAAGTRAIAGDEEAGQLDLVLAHPVSRTRLLLSRVAALAVSLVAIGVVVLLALLAVSTPAELHIGTGRLAAMVIHLVLLGLCFAALAVALGAATGRRARVLAAAAVIAVVAWFGNTIAPQVHMGWLRNVSPFYYYSAGEPLRHGLQWGHGAVLLAVAAALVAAATALFNRRDIAV